MLCTWDYLVERADGKARLSPELKAKDNRASKQDFRRKINNV